eukprot:COSAG04_NODE_18221_length_448_cov_0.911175_1_plen_39_part_01
MGAGGLGAGRREGTGPVSGVGQALAHPCGPKAPDEMIMS